MLAYVTGSCPENSRPPLAGNSVATDRAFVARDMPDLDAYLHYRIVDVSSIKELSRRWFTKAYYGAPVKRGNHRALADIQESIEELRYYREAVFVALARPRRRDGRGIAERVAGSVTGTGTDSGSAAAVLALHFSAVIGSRPVPVVGIAQLVERRVVVADVAGSSPVTHPRLYEPCRRRR